MIRRPGRGFTLLEVLVVVAMVALLVAILMPSIANARKKAERVTCQSQIRQLVSGWHQYLDASGGWFPQGSTLNIDYGGKQGLYNTYLMPKPLNKYLGLPATTPTADAFRCPSDRQGVIDVNGNETPMTCYDYYGTSYKMNRILVGAYLPANPLDPCDSILQIIRDRTGGLTRSQIHDDGRLLLLGDFGWEDSWSLASSNRIEWHGRPNWHNIGFMDGHVDFTPIRKGVYVDGRYTVLPFKSLQSEAAGLQVH